MKHLTRLWLGTVILAKTAFVLAVIVYGIVAILAVAGRALNGDIIAAAILVVAAAYVLGVIVEDQADRRAAPLPPPPKDRV